MPNKPKQPSLKQVAKTYRKSRKNQKTDERGAHFFDSQNNVTSRGRTTSTLDYKPKPRAATFGTSSPKGGGTKRVNKARSK